MVTMLNLIQATKTLIFTMPSITTEINGAYNSYSI